MVGGLVAWSVCVFVGGGKGYHVGCWACEGRWVGICSPMCVLTVVIGCVESCGRIFVCAV